MDCRVDHLFVEQMQRFAVLTSTVGKQVAQSTVIDTALGGSMSSLKTRHRNFPFVCVFLVIQLVIQFVPDCEHAYFC